MKELVEAMARAMLASDPTGKFSFDTMLAEIGIEEHTLQTKLTTCLAQAALAAIEAQGMMVVPVEPTEAMVDLGSEAIQKADEESNVWGDDAFACYRAMLAASPRGGA